MKKSTLLDYLGYSLANQRDKRFIADTNHPPCPRCGKLMDFHTDEPFMKNGEDYWKCPACDLTIDFEEVSPYIEKYNDPNNWWDKYQ